MIARRLARYQLTLAWVTLIVVVTILVLVAT